ncbi:hypothetical protein T265_10431 [Opisthorchis viverrini]|uniref:Uncharacterized protein n=1 Tax=Opisthorchis viverrini TaxID=6198 RepID=A0A074Z2C2_OPIVI|nr:hypothetical protein T265_10431 [Opisthorchis viverrini]KER21176.1 hypothetical protein T265_10431 [Opisthorchis viverrini]
MPKKRSIRNTLLIHLLKNLTAHDRRTSGRLSFRASLNVTFYLNPNCTKLAKCTYSPAILVFTEDPLRTQLKFSFTICMQWPIKSGSAVTPFPCLAATPPEAGTRAKIVPGCPSLDRRSRGVGFAPRAFLTLVVAKASRQVASGSKSCRMIIILLACDGWTTDMVTGRTLTSTTEEFGSSAKTAVIGA